MRKLLIIALILVSLEAFSARKVPPATPIIVADPEFLAQVAPIPATALYTSSVDGDFRVSVYYTAPVANAQHPPCTVNVAWTDEFGDTTNTQQQFGGGGNFHGELVLHAVSGSNIVFQSFSGCGVNSSGQTAYDIYVTVESL